MKPDNSIPEGFKGEKAIVTPYNIRDYQSTNTITRRLYVTHLGFYPRARSHFRSREEGAPENILILCSGGRGWISYNNTRYILTSDTAFLIPADHAHSYGADSRNPWSIYWVHFKGEDMFKYESMAGHVIHLDETDNNKRRERTLLFESIFRNLEMGYAVENLEYISECFSYYLATLKYPGQFRLADNVSYEDTVEKTIVFMKDNLENRVTLQDISTAAGYSVSHLTSLFQKKTSFSPMAYYNQLRIQRACRYLQFSDMKIKEIAYKLCYFDPFHFTKGFIKEMGITPRKYRQKYKESAGHDPEVNITGRNH